ncbi:HDIG domain-containing protein [Kordia algicida OT-1]|uniref:Putative transmembrane HD family protein n=1 Tax=Kordia algicida OT-1 TaxID=391587 RepID=A9EDW0_9FLAO|nr:HDIG domain-containing metalloprotein [Kordia algicida]EDP94183.1 putative transmembrane HD family protein [Kordia algicida OT-1]
MKQIITKLYQNQSFVYKIFLYILTTVLVVYLFPKGGKFQYEFQKGKPWQYETLIAPFDFPINKTKEEIEIERAEITAKAKTYYDYNTEVAEAVKNDFDEQFNELFNYDSLAGTRAFENLKYKTKKLLNSFYKNGIVDTADDSKTDQLVVLIKDNVEQNVSYNNFIELSNIQKYIKDFVAKEALENYETQLYNLFFEIAETNVKVNQEITNNVLTQELNTIAYTRGNVQEGIRIIAKGEVVEGEKLAQLNSLKKEYESQVWNESNYNWIVFGYIILVALALLMLLLFIRKYRPDIYENNNKVTFIFMNIVFMIVLTTLVVKYNANYVYVVPLCILPLILKAFFDARLGLFAHVLTVLLLGFIVPNSSEYIFLQIIAGIVTILTVSELYKRANLFISVGQITLIYIVAYFAFYITHEGGIKFTEVFSGNETGQVHVIWIYVMQFMLCGLATLFVQPLIYIYEKIFGLVSDVSLLELSDTNSKLLKRLANEAPGTFHHSLQVANLAEAAASEIGANTMLVRVGALYHDIGKMNNPTFFIENQATSVNPHDELAPDESAAMIIDHVLDGIEIAKSNKLPDRIIDFIRTHHGTSTVYYFYQKAKELDEEIAIEKFQYPGPIPFSKETAILMMADSVEAASKSLKEPTSQKIDQFVERIIDKQMDEQQFMNADITLKEIVTIKKVLKKKLNNIYHLRIEYPE